MTTLTPPQFVQRWQNTGLNERQSYQLHFTELCDLLGHARPSGEGLDSQGNIFAFEYGVKKDTGGQGFADVFYEAHFAIEYKGAGKYKDLKEAYQQLLQYREQLNNPPLLVVTDIQNWEIHTNWPNTEKRVYKFANADIANRPSIFKLLTDLFESPERLHPDRNTAQVTTDAAEVFRVIADDMRRSFALHTQTPHPPQAATPSQPPPYTPTPSQPPPYTGEESGSAPPTPSPFTGRAGVGSDPGRAGVGSEGLISQRIAHFLTKLVFCLFAEDVNLLPAAPNSSRGIFAEIIERTYREPSRFIRYTQELFEAMASGGEVLFQKIPYFNGSLFDDVQVEEVSPEALGKLLDAAKLNWESVEPAIFGTLFERSLDPSKRAQLGAHYTSREDILLIVEPVLMMPLRREWAAIQAEAAPIRALLDAATTPRDRIKHSRELEALRQKMLKRLREIKVLDPACGSGNFLYVSLQLLMDMEKAVINDPLFAGLTLAIPEVHPRQMYGIEINPIAHDLASIVVWIGYIQWRQNNGYATLTHREPILEALRDNIRQMDAIMTVKLKTSPPSPLSMPATSPPGPLSVYREGESGSPSPPAERGWGEVSEKGWGEVDSPVHREAERGWGEVVERGWSEVDSPVRWKTPAELWELLKPLARQMRHEPTPAEDTLWQALRNRKLDGYKFRRQHAVDRFIVDFYCAEARLVVEVDGLIHDYTQEEDTLRTAYLESQGMRVLRVSNDDVLTNLDGVLARIRSTLTPPQPFPAGGEGLPDSPSLYSGQATPPQPLPAGGEGLPDSPSLYTERGPGGEVAAISEPDWPTVDVIVGNPPFLGGNSVRAELGDSYVDALFKLYEGRIPAFADLVCYWHEKARAQIAAGKARRAGLLATNSIRGGANREVLKRIKDSGDIFMAWSDREWVLNGANVRVSMVGFDDGSEKERVLDGKPVSTVNPDLTAGVNILHSKQLSENADICFMGPSPKGPFDIDAATARRMLATPNPSGRSNSDVVRPVVSGVDIVRQSRSEWTIDFALMSIEEAAKYEMPFEYLKEHVYPVRSRNRRSAYAEKWWQYAEARPGLRNAIQGKARFVVTPTLAKYRLFIWGEPQILYNQQTIVIAREDDYFFGVLHSRLHEVWSLRMGTSLEDRPRYTPTTTFETFPFPWPPGQEQVNSPVYQAVSAAARQLHAERSAWLNPSPKSPPRSAERGLEADSTPPLHAMERGPGGEDDKDRTLTNLYNALNVHRGQEQMQVKAEAAAFAPRLDQLHTALDQAVCAAYGWPRDILSDDEEILRRLLELNLRRAEVNP